MNRVASRYLLACKHYLCCQDSKYYKRPFSTPYLTGNVEVLLPDTVEEWSPLNVRPDYWLKFGITECLSQANSIQCNSKCKYRWYNKRDNSGTHPHSLS